MDTIKTIEKMVEAFGDYTSAFGQALEAHGIEFGEQQMESDRKARQAIQAGRALLEELNGHKDKPCQTCEALARTVMLDQSSHDTTPQQRTWVELTNQDFRDCQQEAQLAVDARRMYDVNFAKAIVSKFKEKNGMAPQAKPADAPQTPEEIEKASAEHYGCTVDEYREFKAWQKAKRESAPQGNDK